MVLVGTVSISHMYTFPPSTSDHMSHSLLDHVNESAKVIPAVYALNAWLLHFARDHIEMSGSARATDTPTAGRYL